MVENLYICLQLLREIKRSRERYEILEKNNAKVARIDFRNEIVLRAYQIYENRFNTPLLNELIIFFLKNVEDFEFSNFSSVPKKFSAQHRTTKNRYEELGKVSLLDHTLRVFVIACQKNKNLSDKVAEEVVLLALLHDFGKCEKVKELTFFQADETHNQVSAKYLSLIMNNLVV